MPAGHIVSVPCCAEGLQCVIILNMVFKRKDASAEMFQNRFMFGTEMPKYRDMRIFLKWPSPLGQNPLPWPLTSEAGPYSDNCPLSSEALYMKKAHLPNVRNFSRIFTIMYTVSWRQLKRKGSGNIWSTSNINGSIKDFLLSQSHCFCLL